jgi:hypothetical protein
VTAEVDDVELLLAIEASLVQREKGRILVDLKDAHMTSARKQG